jgi:hypothetical protein
LLVVIEDVLAEIPDRPVVRLGVVVERDLLDLPVEERGVLRNERLDLMARGPLERPRVGQQRSLGVKWLAVDRAVEDRRPDLADREERVGDVRGMREGRCREVDPLTVGRERELGQPGSLQLARCRLGYRRGFARAFVAATGGGHECHPDPEDSQPGTCGPCGRQGRAAFYPAEMKLR